jgi:hypothetical protein
MTDDITARLVYRERAHLIAHLAAMYPSAIGTDPAEPDWPVVYIALPTGQVSWHIDKSDMDLFAAIPVGTAPAWDGHSTEEKHRRLDEWTQRLAARQSSPAGRVPSC